MGELPRDVVLWTFGYVVVLLVLGALGRRAMRDRSLADFYLAGRTLGFAVLLLTLFATQYSGNSMSGFPGQTYRRGLSYVMSVTFMVGIVSGYLLFAPRLVRIARRLRFITPTDYLSHRFGSRALDVASATIFTVTLANFLLAQLLALGHAFDGLTAGRISFTSGVVGGAAVILAYELLGGMRAVAWTDVLQGTLLLSGLLLVAVLVAGEVGGPAAVVAGIAAVAPEKLAISDWRVCTLWISNFLLLGLGGPLYPQAIQRLYAARRVGELRHALAGMALLPLVGITTVVFLGAVGILLFPDLGPVEADQVTFRVLAFLVEAEPAAYYPVLVVMMAILAAIMSTADSCLLSISSIVGKDLLGRALGLDPERAATFARITPLVSCGVMALLASVALARPTTLWNLLVIKFELLIQLSPAFVLGTLHQPDDRRGYRAPEILAGLATGGVVALGLYAGGTGGVAGFHAGTVGVAVNYAVCWIGRRVRLRSAGRRAAG